MSAVTTLSTLAEQINAEHSAATEHAASAVACARKAGELLILAKAQIAHGDWLSWLSANCAAISKRTAQTYMALARGLPALSAENAQRVAHLPLRKALQTVGENSQRLAKLDPAEQAEVIDAISGGEKASVVIGELRRKKRLQEVVQLPAAAFQFNGREATFERLKDGRWLLTFLPNAVGRQLDPIAWNKAARELQGDAELTVERQRVAEAERDEQILKEALERARRAARDARAALRQSAYRLLECRHGVPQWSSYHWLRFSESDDAMLSTLPQSERLAFANLGQQSSAGYCSDLMYRLPGSRDAEVSS